MWTTRRIHKNPLSAALDPQLSSVQCHPRAAGVCSGLPDPEMSSFPFPATLCPFCAASCAQPLAGLTQRPLFAELPRPRSSRERACLCFSYAGLIPHLHPPQALWSRLPPSLPGPSSPPRPPLRPAALLQVLRSCPRASLALQIRSCHPAQRPPPCWGPPQRPCHLCRPAAAAPSPAGSALERRRRRGALCLKMLPTAWMRPSQPACRWSWFRIGTCSDT